MTSYSSDIRIRSARLLRCCVDITPKLHNQNFLQQQNRTNTAHTTHNTVQAMMLAIQNQRDGRRPAQATRSAGVYAYEENEEYRTGGPQGCIPHASGLKQFWQIFREHFNLKDNSTATVSKRRNLIVDATESTAEWEPDPYLTQASTFDATKEVPTIQMQHVVLPGSDLQQQMAEAMAAKLEEHGEECVICMEPFDPSNPRIPTLCACGENKTYFHLPCLYQWTEQSKDCPSCRQALQWEEF